MLLPVLMVCLALLVQPMCLLYTRTVMQSAAAEGCRLLATARDAPDGASCDQYIRRRLAAVPEVGVFHEGDWRIDCEGDASSEEVRVRIVGHARPLPLVGIVASMLGPTDGKGNVELGVNVSRAARPDWVEGGYGDWTSVWDA